jgi:hypothetical protein
MRKRAREVTASRRYEDAGDGRLTATIPALHGTISSARSQVEARENVVDALGMMLSVTPDDVPEGAATERVGIRLVLERDRADDALRTLRQWL